jgi:hypothetical protein
MAEDKHPIAVRYDFYRDQVIVDGLRFSGDVFRFFSERNEGKLFRLVKVEGGSITIQDGGDRAATFAAIIQFYPDELDFVNATLRLGRGSGNKAESFLEVFCEACLRADAENYELLRPALAVLMKKYPVSAERLRIEREDRGQFVAKLADELPSGEID